MTSSLHSRTAGTCGTSTLLTCCCCAAGPSAALLLPEMLPSSSQIVWLMAWASM